MKLDTMRKIRACVFALGLAMLSVTVTASAQTPSNFNSATTTTPQTRTVVERDDDTDLGWLGLIGLAGLAGLLKKPKQVVVDRTSDTAARGNVYGESKRS